MDLGSTGMLLGKVIMDGTGGVVDGTCFEFVSVWGVPDGLDPFTGMLGHGDGTKVQLIGQEL